MNPRYIAKDGKMAAIWDNRRKWNMVAKVETYIMAARSEIGDIPVPVPEGLENTLIIDPNEIDRLEDQVTKHDVVAFLQHTSSQLPVALRPYWHAQVTSYDVVDTVLCQQMLESIGLIRDRTGGLLEVQRELSLKHKYDVQIGRTHGVHAEPITFGVKVANWYDAFNRRHWQRLAQLEQRVAVGKISGAVGMYTLDPRVEEIVCRRLGLTPVIATQVIPRDIHAEYLSTLAFIGGTIHKMALDLRLGQRTEVRETEEPFRKTQHGSSAMPHKRNPVGLENISGMNRILRGFVIAALENQETMDERDLTNSGPERIILPDAAILLDYMLERVTSVLEGLTVYPERMLRNLELTKGLVFSQDVVTLLSAKSGEAREEMKNLVKDIAMKCWEEDLDFKQALWANEEVRRHVTAEELAACFNLQEKIKYVDYIFNRVFSS